MVPSISLTSLHLLDADTYVLNSRHSQLVVVTHSPGSAPLHLSTPTSFGHAFAHCLDITSAPKKSLLRLLAEHAQDPSEKRTLMFICSRAGEIRPSVHNESLVRQVQQCAARTRVLGLHPFSPIIFSLPCIHQTVAPYTRRYITPSRSLQLFLISCEFHLIL